MLILMNYNTLKSLYFGLYNFHSLIFISIKISILLINYAWQIVTDNSIKERFRMLSINLLLIFISTWFRFVDLHFDHMSVSVAHQVCNHRIDALIIIKAKKLITKDTFTRIGFERRELRNGPRGRFWGWQLRH